MKLNPFEREFDKQRSRTLSEQERDSLQKYIEKFISEGPLLDDFSDVYPAEEISADQQELIRLKKLFTQEKTEELEHHFYAKILELIMMEFANSWIPGYLSKTSEFDDIKRKTDLVFEAETGDGSIIRIGLDVTSSEASAVEKISSILKDIERGSVDQSLKYFKSELDETKGQIRLPRLIIGASREEIIELARTYLNYKNAKPEYRASVIQRIENHPLGTELLDELLVQLKSFALRISTLKNNRETVTKLRKLENELVRYRKEKEETRHSNDAVAGQNRILESIIGVLG